MELGGGGDVVNGPAGSRWNPTADQITLLEGLYKQGIRTPSAEQIQQITARLKVFGHIEGKNVFYWFQNHKARQRQKQKQENVAYFNRCYLRAAPVGYPSANFQNAYCSPYYLPTKELSFFQRYPTVLLQSGIANRPILPSTTNYYNLENSQLEKTLPLFPVEPTGVLQTRDSSTTTHSSSSEIDEQPNFFDFFAVNGSCESD